MAIITFFDLLGIDLNDPSAVDLAAKLWPNDVVSQTPGYNVGDDSIPLVTFLQGHSGSPTLQFSNVRPGVDGSVLVGSVPGQITLAADVAVTSDVVSLQQHTFYFRQLPDVGVTLFPTKPGAPARCFFASDSRGWELIVEALPAVITMKSGVIQPYKPTDATDGDDVTEYNEDELDNLVCVRYRDQGTQFYTNVRLHILPGGDVLFEPNIPLDQGPCRFLGLPVTAFYDFLLIPAPHLREYYEWARNDLGGIISGPVNGAIGFRSVIFDFSQPPFSDLVTSLQGGSVNTNNIELVCEDVVFPLSFLMVPLPSHGTLGFRRKIIDRSDLNNAFSLTAAPVVIQLYPRPSPSSDPSNASTTQSDSKWSLSIDEILIQSGDPPVIEFQTAIIWQNATGSTVGGSISVADDWTVQLGVVLGDASPVKFTIADTTVSVHALKLGLGIGRLIRRTSFADSWQVLVDLSIVGKSSSSTLFKLATLTGKPLSLIVRDLGYSFGHFSVDGLTFPEGVQLIICDTLRLIIEEMGWVEEATGVSYFSFSGGLSLGFGSGVPNTPSGAPKYGTPTDANANPNQSSHGFGIEVRRLRFRTEDSSTEPFWKIDGISIYLKYTSVLIAGFGFLSDLQQNGWQIREMGFGVQIKVKVLSTDWNIAAQFFKGHRVLLASPTQAFEYFLAGLTVGYLPAGSVGFYAVRVLVANNMTPAVDPPSTDGEGLVLYKWHKDHDTAIDMPRDRNLNDWNAVDNSLACGMGCGFSFNGCGSAIHLNIFILLSQSEALRGLLVVGELFLLKNVNPIAFVAIEYDINTEKFGLLAGLNLKIKDLVGSQVKVPDWINGLVSITGNIYFGNQKWTIAVGQLADQRTWPCISVTFKKSVVVSIDIDFVLAVCFEYAEGGSKGFGVMFAINAGAKWGIGQVCFFGSIGFMFGHWKTGSDATGIEAWVQVGCKIYLFYVLHIGLDVTAKISYLGKTPWYTTLSLTLRIDTPWWMPDVSFTYDKTWSQSLPFDVDVATRGLSSASGVSPGTANEALLVPPLSDGVTDASSLYSFNALTKVAGVPLGDVHLRNDIPIVATDATVAINFTNPVSNDMAVASDTYSAAGDAGVQTVQDLQIRYGLKNIGVRRSPRFGAGAGNWTDLVTPSDTELDLSGTLHLAPALAFRWDADSRENEILSPKRLLINSSTPYTFTTGSLQNDEEALRNDPGYPCCQPSAAYKEYYPAPHLLTFLATQAGRRVSQRQQFSNQGSWWNWIATPLPLVKMWTATNGVSTPVAAVQRSSGVLGSVAFQDPAFQVWCSLSWLAGVPTLHLEGYNGLQLVASATTPTGLSPTGSQTLMLNTTLPQGMTRVVLRSDTAYYPNLYSLQVEQIEYITVAEQTLFQGRIARCGSMSTTGGKLSFLPNYDYEVTVTTEVKVSTKSQGERSQMLAEVTYFRTKGLPGLNSVANTGDEIEPYIESLYPPMQNALLYREEPVVVAFSEGMSTILPVDRVNAPTDPPEKTQALELALNMDRVGSTSGLARLTVPSVDWIDAHRATPAPPRQFPQPIVDGVSVRSSVRKAVSADPLALRFLALQGSSAGCSVDPLSSSQVLLHQPLGADNQAGPWESSTTLRASVRQKDGPYTQRNAFDLMDSGAFVSQADGTASPAGAWNVSPAQTLIAPVSGAGRQYASFGDLSWNHLQVRATFDPHGAPVGIAVGVAGGDIVPQAMLATVEGSSLVLRSLSAGLETELARTAVTVSAPITLTVYAFDDTVRAQAGDAIVEAPRGAIREGRCALLSNGPAEFSALSADGLDLYRFDLRTSRYQSFTEHVQSWDGLLPELGEGTASTSATDIADLLAADASAIAALMLVEADPQARQVLFTKWTTALALPLRQTPQALSISRWTGAAGTEALLIESPEPISFVRDVSVSLVADVAESLWQPTGEVLVQAALSHLVFSAVEVTTALADAVFVPGDHIIQIGNSPAGVTLTIYAAPEKTLPTVTPGHLLEVVPPTQTPSVVLAPLLQYPEGTVVLVRNGIVEAKIFPGVSTRLVDQPLGLMVFDNGSETAALLLPITGAAQLAPLSPQSYTLTLSMKRSRWRDPASVDPQSAYLQQQSIALSL